MSDTFFFNPGVGKFGRQAFKMRFDAIRRSMCMSDQEIIDLEKYHQELLQKIAEVERDIQQKRERNVSIRQKFDEINNEMIEAAKAAGAYCDPDKKPTRHKHHPIVVGFEIVTKQEKENSEGVKFSLRGDDEEASPKIDLGSFLKGSK